MLLPVEFDHGPDTLRGSFHLPEGQSGPLPVVLFCHGFTGSRVGSHRIAFLMSRALERRGIASLRFDFAGCGESDGSFEEATLEKEIEEATTALRWLEGNRKLDLGRLGLLGISLGGSVAAVLAGRNPRVRSLVLWAGVARPEKVVAEKLDESARETLARQGLLDVGGILLGKPFVDSLRGVKPLEGIERSRAAILIIQGSMDETVPVEESEAFYRAALYRDKKGDGTFKSEKLLIEGADHTFNYVRWQNLLLQKSLEWFAETL